MQPFRIGFVGFGEVNTPRELLETKVAAARQRLLAKGIEVVDGGLVTDDPRREESAATIRRLSDTPLDALILCVAGWIPSYALIRTADPFKKIPMVLWGLCGCNCPQGHLVTTAEQAGTSALRRPMEELGFQFTYVYDTTDGLRGEDAMQPYLRLLRAKKELQTAKALSVGYRDMNLYGTMYDGVRLKRCTGIEVEQLEMLEMVRRAGKADEAEARALLNRLRESWHFNGREASDETLLRGIRYYLALRDIIRDYGYNAITINDVDGMKKLEGFPPAMVFMLLAQELGVCTIPENDVTGSATQLIVHALTGQIGAYMEFYEFMQDRVLMGVPDYVPDEVVDGRIEVTTTKFGLLDSCVLNVSKVKTGTVTLCRLFSDGDGYGMHIALADAVAPRKWEEAGWEPPAPQLPSLEMFMGERTAHFTANVMGQHYILCYGDHRRTLEDYCKLSGITILCS